MKPEYDALELKPATPWSLEKFFDQLANWKSTGQLAADAKVGLILYDPNTGKIITNPKKIPIYK